MVLRLQLVEKVIALLRDFREEIRDFEMENRGEVSLDFYMDEISGQIAKIAYLALQGHPEEFSLLLERFQQEEDKDIDSLIFQTIMDAFILNLSIIDPLSQGGEDDLMEETYENWRRRLEDYQFFRRIVQRTIGYARRGDIFSAILLSAKIFNFGVQSFLKGNIKGLGRALDYQTLLTIKLYNPDDAKIAPLKLSLYTSHLILTHMVMLKGGVLESLHHYRRRSRSHTRIANMIERHVKSNDGVRISLAIKRANKMAAHLAAKSIQYRNDWVLMRELLELYWLSSNLRSDRNMKELKALQNNLEAAIHVVNDTEQDLRLAQSFVEEDVKVRSEEDARELTVSLTASAIKLLTIGLKEHSYRVEEFMERCILKKRLRSNPRINLEFLRHFKEEVMDSLD